MHTGTSIDHGARETGAGSAAPAPSATAIVIADRGEFIETLKRLRRGEVLVHSDDADDERCLIEGQVMWTSWKPLRDYGLLDEVPRGPRDGRIHCYRLSPRGREFADQACQAWRQRPLWQRLLVRLVG